MDAANGSAKSSGGADAKNRWQIPAYYNNRALPREELKPSASEVHWEKLPVEASEIHPQVGFQHQALPWRSTPHPTDGAMKRWPGNGYTTSGGPPEPLDDRRFANWFAYPQQRWRRHFIPEQSVKGVELETPQFGLSEVILLLTNRFGNLKTAFDHLDFFKDKHLSVFEFQEGLYKIFSTMTGPRCKPYRAFCEHRWLFNKRMLQIFNEIDKDDDGLITFEELAAPHREPKEKPRDATLRRASELQCLAGLEPTASLSMPAGVTLASMKTLRTDTRARSAPKVTVSIADDAAREGDEVLTQYSEVASTVGSEAEEDVAENEFHTTATFRAGASTPMAAGPLLAQALTSAVDGNKATQAEPSAARSLPWSIASVLDPPGAKEGEAASPSKTKKVAGVKEPSKQLRAFGRLLLSKYPSCEKAFASLDHSGNGLMSMGEFVDAVKMTRFPGNAKALFRELDSNGDGFIGQEEFKALRALPPAADSAEDDDTGLAALPSKKEIVVGRRERSPIKAPKAHARDVCLASTHVQLPHGEKVSSTAGFYTFDRSCTGRVDHALHPNELPGMDPENFNPEHGPGYLAKGPDFFAEVACHTHPLRGNKFKLGSTISRSERFGPAIPSAQGRHDRELSGARSFTYEGQHPRDTWKVSGTGSHSLATRQPRMGPTMSNENTCGLQAPKPIGRWQDSRITLRLKTRSEPSLLRMVC